jgi:uncharacterized protein YbcI
MPATTDTSTSQDHAGQVASAISTATVHLLREYTGRGPTRAKTYMNQDVITIVLQDTLTKGERSLAAGGESASVLHTRQLFQQTMRGDLVEAVERLSGRKVQAFMSANHIDPDMAVETFVLEPDPEPDAAE